MSQEVGASSSSSSSSSWIGCGRCSTFGQLLPGRKPRHCVAVMVIVKALACIGFAACVYFFVGVNCSLFKLACFTIVTAGFCVLLETIGMFQRSWWLLSRMSIVNLVNIVLSTIVLFLTLAGEQTVAPSVRDFNPYLVQALTCTVLGVWLTVLMCSMKAIQHYCSYLMRNERTARSVQSPLPMAVVKVMSDHSQWGQPAKTKRADLYSFWDYYGPKLDMNTVIVTNTPSATSSSPTGATAATASDAAGLRVVNVSCRNKLKSPSSLPPTSVAAVQTAQQSTATTEQCNDTGTEQPTSQT
ncbi:unnamed protein product [Soboliphyme baturini]|uniref:MARVEL domain-containing protein n=1 Tax=Soboliphyme baturini TaxID=241478 RepID=A0A183ICI6_9BILA|nr:unnamed protein product [Soboliphyme baturini]